MFVSDRRRRTEMEENMIKEVNVVGGGLATIEDLIEEMEESQEYYIG